MCAEAADCLVNDGKRPPSPREQVKTQEALKKRHKCTAGQQKVTSFIEAFSRPHSSKHRQSQIATSKRTDDQERCNMLEIGGKTVLSRCYNDSPIAISQSSLSGTTTTVCKTDVRSLTGGAGSTETAVPDDAKMYSSMTQSRVDAAIRWKAIREMYKPVKCSGHGEECVIRQVSGNSSATLLHGRPFM
jgi:hypothetical protein